MRCDIECRTTRWGMGTCIRAGTRVFRCSREPLRSEGWGVDGVLPVAGTYACDAISSVARHGGVWAPVSGPVPEFSGAAGSPSDPKDGQWTEFFRWLAHTHAMRYRVSHDTVGYGHLYQGRYKSFPVQPEAPPIRRMGSGRSSSGGWHIRMRCDIECRTTRWGMGTCIRAGTRVFRFSRKPP